MATFIKLMERKLVKWKRKAKMPVKKMMSISISMLNKLHASLYLSMYKLWVNILWYITNIFSFFILIIYVLFAFTHTVSNFYIGLLFTRTIYIKHGMNFLSMGYHAHFTVVNPYYILPPAALHNNPVSNIILRPH